MITYLASLDNCHGLPGSTIQWLVEKRRFLRTRNLRRQLHCLMSRLAHSHFLNYPNCLTNLSAYLSFLGRNCRSFLLEETAGWHEQNGPHRVLDEFFFFSAFSFLNSKIKGLLEPAHSCNGQ